MIGLSPAKKTAAKKTAAKKTTKKSTAKKTAAKKTTAKKPVAKKTTAKKPVAKKTAAKKTTAKKPVAKKPAQKTAAKKTPAKKTAAKKPVAKKTAAKPVAKKTAVKKAPAKTAAATKTPAKKTIEEAPAPKRARGEKPVFKTPIRKLPVEKKKTPRPAKLSADDLKRIREQLQSDRGDLVKQQEELEEDTFTGTQSDLTGEVGLDEDFADAGTATFDRERDLSIRNNIRDLIEQIDRATRRIDEGLYGTCERCGQPIDAARLKALPHASLCLDCKRREERVR